MAGDQQLAQLMVHTDFLAAFDSHHVIGQALDNCRGEAQLELLWVHRHFAELAFSHVGLNFEDHVEFDPRYLRPAEVNELLGNPAKAKQKLGWEPETTVEELAGMMVEHDLEAAKREKTLLDAGHELPAFAGHDQ